MTHDEAMNGHPLTFGQARAELQRHGFSSVRGDREGYFLGLMPYGDGTVAREEVALNSRAVLEWLGY